MRKTKQEIADELQHSFNTLCQTCRAVDGPVFNQSREGRWTPAENFSHLVTATRITGMAFTLPKVVHVLLYGKPRRASHGFSKVVDNYTRKLNEGAKATGLYVPRKTNYNQQLLSDKLQKEGKKLITALNSKWTEEQLDNYQIAHPILGLLTVRELAYFTIYHNQHHLETVRRFYL